MSAPQYYFGVASWFCCGNAYGPCSSAGTGACGTCQSSDYQCAWPKIGTGCRYNACYYSDSNAGMATLNCGDSVLVTNPCNNYSLYVTVADCGPHMSNFCDETAPDCSPSAYYDRIIDLTPAAFSYFAPLDQGLMSAEVDV